VIAKVAAATAKAIVSADARAQVQRPHRLLYPHRGVLRRKKHRPRRLLHRGVVIVRVVRVRAQRLRRKKRRLHQASEKPIQIENARAMKRQNRTVVVVVVDRKGETVRSLKDNVVVRVVAMVVVVMRKKVPVEVVVIVDREDVVKNNILRNLSKQEKTNKQSSK